MDLWAEAAPCLKDVLFLPSCTRRSHPFHGVEVCLHLLGPHRAVHRKATPTVVEVLRQGDAYQARGFSTISAPLPVALLLVVLDKVAFPLGKRPLVSHRACEFEVRLGLTLQKGLENVVCDEHTRLSQEEKRKTSNVSGSLPKRPSLQTSSTERMHVWQGHTERS